MMPSETKPPCELVPERLRPYYQYQFVVGWLSNLRRHLREYPVEQRRRLAADLRADWKRWWEEGIPEVMIREPVQFIDMTLRVR